MIVAYHLLSLAAMAGRAGLCLWLGLATLRVLMPAALYRRLGDKARQTFALRRDDGIQAAFFLIVMNEIWFSGRRILFGARFDTMHAYELPYLNAALVWSLFCTLVIFMVVRPYRNHP